NAQPRPAGRATSAAVGIGQARLGSGVTLAVPGVFIRSAAEGPMATREELDAWVRACAPWALAYARSLIPDSARAEDVVQHCFSRLLARRDGHDLPRDGHKLLYRAITTAAINATTRRRQLASLDALAGGDGDGAGWEPCDPAAFTPEQLSMRNELQDAVAEG